MIIHEDFIKDILVQEFGKEYAVIFDNSCLLQYLDVKMKAVHGDSKARRSLANIYAIYSILYFYADEFVGKRKAYCQFAGYDFTKLFNFCRSMYGGSKLQNHAFNNRLNFEFKRRLPAAKNDLMITEHGKYLLHVDYLYVGDRDISQVAKKIIERYIELLMTKDNALASVLQKIKGLSDYGEKRSELLGLLNEDAEARVFEIISFAILKNHFSGIKVYFGYEKDAIREERLRLYKTGRTNANDGGIDFVMRPVGRFFQVTEVDNYDKYLLDIDKVMHFPVTFVIKTAQKKEEVRQAMTAYIEERAHGMAVIKNRYEQAVEEVVTINELRSWTASLSDSDVDGIIRDIDLYYRIEMNLSTSDLDED